LREFGFLTKRWREAVFPTARSPPTSRSSFGFRHQRSRTGSCDCDVDAPAGPVCQHSSTSPAGTLPLRAQRWRLASTLSMRRKASHVFWSAMATIARAIRRHGAAVRGARPLDTRVLDGDTVDESSGQQVDLLGRFRWESGARRQGLTYAVDEDFLDADNWAAAVGVLRGYRTPSDRWRR
jgi:hypothetical protein